MRAGSPTCRREVRPVDRCATPLGWTSADAAGLPILPGLVRYDEVAAGEIGHAIRVTFSQTQRGFILPASHSRLEQDGSRRCRRWACGSGCSAGFDIGSLTGQAKVIAAAMQRYGLIVADNGSNWYFQGAPDPALERQRPEQLKAIPGTAFEVVDTGPVITGLITMLVSGPSRPAFTRVITYMSDLAFTHLDPMGRARMVDVTPKEPTHRRAVARCKVFMKPETTAAIANREVKKGDVLAVARVAGIQAAKRTSDMIPLCHPLLVGSVHVNFEIGDDHVAIEAQVDTVDRTGVEMEALHACAIAALTIYDMCKSADRGMVIGELALWEKTGGRSGTYRRADNVTASVTNVVDS